MAFDMFEKTMKACVESRDARSAKKSAKNLTETKKRPAKKAVTEKISRLKKESEEDDDLEMDFADGIIAVRDPELDDDAMTAVAKGFQDIIDSTEEGEIPETSEYIGKSIYGCPVCGETFFSDKSLEDGGVCPICGEEATSFVLAGDVEASEDDIMSDEEDFGEYDFDGEELEDIEGDDEDVDIDIEIKGDPEKKSDEDEDEKKESFKKEGKACVGKDCDDEGCDSKKAKAELRKPARRAIRPETRRPIRRTSRVERPMPTRRPARRPVARTERSLATKRPSASAEYLRKVSNERRLARKPVARTESKVTPSMNLDEKTFNKYLNKFAFENYKNVKSFEVVGASKEGDRLSLECKVSYKNGNTATTTLTGVYTKESRIMRCKDDGILKAESSKVAPISFRVSTRGNVIRCEGMSYNFNTKAKIENKITAVNVKGSYISESTPKQVRKPVARASRRVSESRRRAVRPASRKVTESRNRRTSIRRRSIR